MKLTPVQKIKILKSLEEYKIEYGKVVWEFIVQDGKIVTIHKIREDMNERIV